MSDKWKRVGTVEVLRQRVYAIDPNNGDRGGTEVVVEPGPYPVYRKCDAYRWMMRGRVNERNEKIGDGLFILHAGDRPAGPKVKFPSRTFGAEQFAELLEEPVCQPGPEQRLRFSIDSEVSA
jgi:hypothetical protein